MKIKIFPKEIVELCLWDTYSYYVVRDEKEAERILSKNEEIELTPNDALVVGLVKVVETDNLIHKFNDYLIHILNIKSAKIDDDFLIKKRTILVAIEKFRDKFPSYYVPGDDFKWSVKQVFDYIQEVEAKILLMSVRIVTDSTGKYEFYHSNTIRKILNFHHC